MNYDVSYETFGKWWWQWLLHDFWTQIAIVAVLHVLNSHDRLLAEVMPIVPPWEHPTWLS